MGPVAIARAPWEVTSPRRARKAEPTGSHYVVNKWLVSGRFGYRTEWLVSFGWVLLRRLMESGLTMVYSLRCPIRSRGVSRRSFRPIRVVGRRCGWLAILLRKHTSECQYLLRWLRSSNEFGEYLQTCKVQIRRTTTHYYQHHRTTIWMARHHTVGPWSVAEATAVSKRTAS